jgi:zinc protease
MATFGTDSWLRIQSGYPRTQGTRLAGIVREEVQLLIKKGITAQELEQARRSILEERQLVFRQDQNILSQLPTQLYRGQTYQDWIERNNAFATVTLEQVNAAIRKYLTEAIWVEVLADRDGKS